MKKILFLLLIAFQSVLIFSQNVQNNWCGMDYMLEKQFAANPLLRSEYELWQQKKDEGRMEKSSDGTVQIIPVVVHVIHDNGKGNISVEQIKDGIRVLNEDFMRLNKDSSETRNIFKPHAAVADFEFRLATVDPNGNPTNGIVRINSSQTYDANDDTKSLSYWNSSNYFNLWLVNTIEGSSQSSTILGYAQFPGWGNWNTYGVIMLHTRFGRVETSGGDGRTASHEIGHCLDLYHTFQGGCGNSCSNSGDRVCDTPPTANSTQGCSLSQNLCSNDAGSGSPYTSNVEDQIENYMSYDDCQNMFSIGQKTRMKAAINANTQLTNLVSDNNHTATGINILSRADFSSDIKVICTGQSVKFYDDSQYNPTDRIWAFSGGTPFSSTEQNPTVTYNTPGVYSVSITVSDGSITKSKTKNNYILVMNSTGTPIPFSEEFESNIVSEKKWGVINPDDDEYTFERITGAGFSGNACIKMNNFNNDAGMRDELIIGSFDLTTMESPTLKFKAAYSQKNSSSSDKLQVSVSTDCGKTWSPRYGKSGSALATVSEQTSEFTPSDSSHWTEHNVTLTSGLLKNGVLFKFAFESGDGNNLYIDDININNYAVGQEEMNTSDLTFAIYPNPVAETSTVFLSLSKSGKVSIEVFDVTGRKTAIIANQYNFSAGEHQFTINKKDFASGLYFLKIASPDKTVVSKFTVE